MLASSAEMYLCLLDDQELLSRFNKFEQHLNVASRTSVAINTDDGTEEPSSFREKAAGITIDMENAKALLVGRLRTLRDVVEQRNEASRMYSELAAWFEVVKGEVQEMESRPAKLHVLPASMDVQLFEVN